VKGKFLALLLCIGILPILVVGGAGLYSMFLAPQGAGPAPEVSSPPPDLALAQTRVQETAASMLKAITGAQSDLAGVAEKANAAEFQSYLASHPGVSVVYQLDATGKPILVTPSDSNLIDAAYGATEEFQNILKRTAWPYTFYSRRVIPALVFVNKNAAGQYVGAVLDIAYFFKSAGYAKSENLLVDSGTGTIMFSSLAGKVGTTFSVAGETWRDGVLQGIGNKVPGTQVTPQTSAAYAPLGLASFGIVQAFSMTGVSGGAAKKVAAAEGLTLEKVMKDPAALLQNPLVLALLGALGWVLVAGFFFRSRLLKPVDQARQLLESAVTGQNKVSEEALKKVGAPEVEDLVRVSTQWANRLEREKEDLSRRREEDLQRANAQMQQRGQELADAVQKLGNAKQDVEQKEQTITAKQQELEALKGMSEGLRNQAEQARGEIAKLKTQNAASEAEAKKRESDLQRQMDLQANQTKDQLKDLETKLLQVVAAAGSINVSRVRVAAIKTMSEELKTTLGIIKGYVSSALGSGQAGITEKQQEFLGMVINRSARLEKFINDLVDVFQVEIDQETAPREEVSLASEIEGMAFNFQPQADIKNIKIRVEEKGGPLPKVPIVRRRFTQLWNILYLQIIKDAPRGSQVPVTVESVGEDVKVTVLDPGLNVKAEHLPQLFDEFYDPKHPASTQLAGTGLKFALVKTILGAHGGGALAEKAEPGTKLTLTFPTKIKKKENPAAAILAQVKLPSASTPPSGGLLGAVKPGTIPAKAAGAPTAAVPKPGMPTMASPAKGPLPIPGLTPGVAKPAAPGLSVPPAKPAMPPTPPALGAGGGLDAILSAKAAPPPTAPKPAASLGLPPMPPSAPKVAPPPSAAPGAAPGAPKPPMDLNKLFGTQAPGAAPAPAPKPAASVPPTAPAPGMINLPPSLKPPVAPGLPSGLKPPSAPMPGAPPSPTVMPKIVPTTIKPSAPPPGILDLDSQDGMKTESVPSAPRPAASPIPPPSAPPAGAGKPIVKDLDKENGDSGDLIE